MGGFMPAGYNGITDYRSNCIANQQLAHRMGSMSGQDYRHNLMNQSQTIMEEQKQQNARKHQNACVACPSSNQPGIFQRVMRALFG